MRATGWILSGLVMALYLGTSVSPAFSDDDRRAMDDTFTPVADSLYSSECGACHMAYPPGTLPARSWEKIMADLAHHFGENAETLKEDRERITRYLQEHAADRVELRYSRRLLRGVAAGETPLRITKLPYFVREHREVPRRVLKAVKSISNCDSCHTRANEGSFREHEIKMPGLANWEDE